MKPLIKTVTLLSLFTILISCNEQGTNPNKTIKTPREMTWTADTLTSPDPSGGQLMMENILVFSTNDVWVCGWNDIARGLIWHYDGTKWRESNIVEDTGGMRVNDIAGYSSSDLWTVGYSGQEIFLAHFDGQHWTRQNNMGIKGELLDMSKDPSGNIWACGRNGLIMKYDQTRWIADTIKIKFPYPAEYFLKSIEYYDGKIYVLASSLNTSTLVEKYFFVSGNINNWTIADSMDFSLPTSIRKWGYRGLYSSSYNKFYSFGLGGVWSYQLNNWINKKSVSGAINGMFGKDENYLFAVGDFQKVLFYDGNNWSDIRDLFHLVDPYFVFENVWTDGYETFIISRNFQGYPVKTIIFHGK